MIKFSPVDFPNGFDAEQLRLDLIAAFKNSFNLQTAKDYVQLDVDSLIDSTPIIAVCKAHFAKDWTVANSEIKRQISVLESQQDRAIREAVILGDKTRLQAIDSSISSLRSKLK